MTEELRDRAEGWLKSTFASIPEYHRGPVLDLLAALLKRVREERDAEWVRALLKTVGEDVLARMGVKDEARAALKDKP